MLLELNHINYRYPGTEIELFKRLEMRLDRPGFHALFGPSGVGKTTLARIISGGVNGYAGRLQSAGCERILYSYNLERLPGWSNVGQHIAKVTPQGRQGRMRELLDCFGLAPSLASRFFRLSLGQKNRANLTRYLLQDFDLLIMDESLANVDESTREQIILKIKEMFPDKAFLYISHNLVEVSRFCADIFVLRHPENQPQLVSVSGCDWRRGEALSREALEHTMLEVLHAA